MLTGFLFEATQEATRIRDLSNWSFLFGEKMYKSISGGGAVESSRAQVEYSAFEKWFHPSKSTPTA